MTLIAIYTGCLVLGGILIGASMLGAGKDADTAGEGADASAGSELEGGDHDLAHNLSHEHDLSHDHDHAHDGPTGTDDGGSAVAATLLSLRFWTFSLASFGMTGLLLTAIGVSDVPGLLLAVGMGLAIGSGVTTMMRAFGRDTVSSALDSRSLRGRDAEVVLAVGPDKVGKIRMVHNGQIIELLARTREERRLERGERALVVEVSGGEAVITSAAPERRPPPPSLSTHP